ncbi:hypothetical protein [Streptomyces sp. NPDC059802]|uniref:hypothetical protein n=1 Tax=Streptomyces sp. NPDC059802 TaxID=3346952 RepID=UPI00365F2E03
MASLPTGFIGYGAGTVMAAADSLDVTLHGRGAHGSRPEASTERGPELTWFSAAPALVSEPEATQTTVAAFTEDCGAQRITPMP